jgi:hypothetical protein
MKRIFMVAVGLCCMTAPMFATIELRLQSGVGDTGVIVGAACGTETCVSFSGTVGQWTINLTSGDSTGPGGSVMDLSSLNATSTAGAADLTILLTDHNFTTATPGFTMASSGNLVSGSGSVLYKAYVDNSNTLFGTPGAGLIGTLGPFTASYNTSVSSGPPAGVPQYALTEVLTLHNSGSGVKWSTDSSIAPVPEPTGVVLLGSALLGVSMGLRKKFSKKSLN